MLSKEEVLYKHENVDEKTMKDYPNGYPYIYKAMDEHAQQMSIGFAQFISNHPLDFQPATGGNYIGLNLETISCADLYQLYLNQLNAK